MTLFTPALLLFMPFWATAMVLQTTVPDRTKSAGRLKAAEADDESCPTRWASMPFTPPPVQRL